MKYSTSGLCVYGFISSLVWYFRACFAKLLAKKEEQWMRKYSVSEDPIRWTIRPSTAALLRGPRAGSTSTQRALASLLRSIPRKQESGQEGEASKDWDLWASKHSIKTAIKLSQRQGYFNFGRNIRIHLQGQTQLSHLKSIRLVRRPTFWTTGSTTKTLTQSSISHHRIYPDSEFSSQ